jgi:hypothetical protein
MSGMTNISPVSQAALSGTARSLARIEKPSVSSSLHDGGATYDGRNEASPQRTPPQRLSRSETESAPRWYGPRLAAPFVAQILGQVLPHAEADARSASAAYKSAPAIFRAGICLDREV